MTEGIRKEIEVLKSKLQYPLNTIEWENHWWGHRFNPLGKYHEIVYPNDICLDSFDVNGHILDYLHELIHAYYSETIHPLFGGFAFEDDYSEEVVIVVSHVYRVACDWFIWDKLVKLAPNAGCEEIDNFFIGYMDDYNPEIQVGYEQGCYTYGLVLALACKYLKLPLRDDGFQKYDNKDDYLITKLAEVFIAIEPDVPTIDKLEVLMNDLLALGYKYRAKFIDCIHFPTIEITDN